MQPRHVTSRFCWSSIISYRGFALLVATLALWLANIDLPGPAPNDLGSWQTILIDAHLHGRQFGPEIVFTYGPWGYLELGGYLPAALTSKLVWEIFGKLALSVTTILLSAALPSARRWVFLALLVCAACFFDQTAAVLVTVMMLIWLIPAGATWWQRALAIGWLSLLAHFKFVFCLQAIAGITIAVATNCAERRFRTGLILLLSFLSAYAVWWVAAGQSLLNLPTYWRLSWEISSGYSWGMALEPPASALMLGLLVAVMCGAFLWMIWRGESTPMQRAGAALVAMANWFVAWKQGFVRADLHVFTFFLFCLLLGIALPGLIGRRRRMCWHDFVNPALCIAGIATVGSGLLAYGPRIALNRLRHQPYELTHLSEWRQRFIVSLRREQEAANDLALKATVGNGTVDLLNFDQGLLFLNGLNYQSRPVVQSYSTYTPALLEANRRFFQSTRAPDFVVVRLNTVDGRYPGQDDSLALAEFVRGYQVAKIDLSFVVLSRKSPAPKPENLTREALAQMAPHYGDEMAVPDGHGHPVWMAVDFRPTLLGKLRAFLYQASPPNMIATFEDGRHATFRVVPSTSNEGFFVRPFLENHRDLAALILGRDSNWPRTIRFEFAKSSGRWFWRRPRVRFSALTDLPLVRTDSMDTMAAHAIPARVHADQFFYADGLRSTLTQGAP
jgi:hypothetical protein